MGEKFLEDGIVEGFVGMTEGRAEDARAFEVVDPDNGMGFSVAFADGGGEGFRAGPEFVDDVEFVGRGGPDFREVFHDRMRGVGGFDGILRHMIVATAGDPEEFAPVVNGRFAVGVHCAMDDHGGRAAFVAFGDAADVFSIFGIGKAFVVDDDVVAFGPIEVFIKVDLGGGAGARILKDGPLHVRDFADGLGDRLGLESVVVAAAAGDDQGAQWFVSGQGIDRGADKGSKNS